MGQYYLSIGNPYLVHIFLVDAKTSADFWLSGKKYFRWLVEVRYSFKLKVFQTHRSIHRTFITQMLTA